MNDTDQLCTICLWPIVRGTTTQTDVDTGDECHAGCVAMKLRKRDEDSDNG